MFSFNFSTPAVTTTGVTAGATATTMSLPATSTMPSMPFTGGFAFSSAPTLSQPATTTAFGFPAAPAASIPAPSTIQQPTSTFTFPTSSTVSQPTTSTFSFPAAPAATTTSTITAPTTSLFTAPTSSTITVPSIPTTTSTGPGQASATKMTFSQLQEHINKWLDELTILEGDFHEQAQNINAWDSILINNANKLTTISEKMEQLKTEHTRINNQIDFIESQQNELEELIKPLEDEKSKMLDTVVVSEKEKFYHLMETVNNDLQGVAADIQTVIEQFNSANSIKDMNDPLASIGKILNTHMTLLKHIDDQISSIDVADKI